MVVVMKFKLYREYGALNSTPVFNAFENGLLKLGHQVVCENEEVAVIWSVLWKGRLAHNAAVYNNCVANNIPVVILEVGTLIRGTTWKVSLFHINGDGIFGNTTNCDNDRPAKLGLKLSTQLNPKPEILIACQHYESLQWKGQPDTETWINNILGTLSKYTDRNVIVRPHPRSPLSIKYNNIQTPVKLPTTYDNFDIRYDYHCVINFNSGPAVQAAIAGSPVICDVSSLAYPVSTSFDCIENPQLPERAQWFIELTHTEWTLDEIEQGLPLLRLQF